MNENFKLSKTSRNDLESICIVIRSVPAKFGLPRMFRRGTRGWIQLSQISTQSIRDYFGDSKLGAVKRLIKHKYGCRWLIWFMSTCYKLQERSAVLLVHGMNENLQP